MGRLANTYTTNGWLRTRTWARGVSATNTYSVIGDQTGIAYSDGTPAVTFATHDRRGLPRSLTDGTGTHALLYDVLGRTLSDTANGITVSNHFHTVYGRDYLKITGLSASLQHNYGYDGYGRLGTVSDGARTAYYGYLANSDLLQTTALTNAGNTFLTSRTWDYGFRLRSIQNSANGSAVSAHAYLYDGLNRRFQATLEDGSLWQYQYNDRNELIAGKRFWADWTPVAGQQFAYGFDSIANRTNTWSGGDQSGGNLRSASYTANALNQITSRGVPASLDVIGAAYATASVTVNGSAADCRKGEYYWESLAAGNGSGPVWLGVTNIATQGTSTTNTGCLLVPPQSQSFAYDRDGNLTNDSVWVYRYDAENRLVEMTNLTTVTSSARQRLVFDYDHLGRRTRKTVYPWSGSDYSGTPSSDTRFFYDGWNLIAAVNAATTNNTVVQSFLWGKDLGGDLDTAGGIGGLVLVTDHGAGTYHFAGYDGNGNLTALLKVSDASLSARYEFGPFGEPIRASGTFAKAQPFRWSTKFTDAETDLVYYGRRLYSPSLGRWINRDPVEEDGGMNLYATCANAVVNSIDSLGLAQDKQPTFGLPEAFWRAIHDDIKREFGGPLTKEQARIRYAEWLEEGMPKGPRGRKGFKFGGGQSGRGAMIAMGGAILIGLATDALARSSGLDSYFEYESQSSLLVNMNDYVRHREGGDSAFADLDAAMIAIDVLNLTGESAVALWAWEAVSQ